MLWHFAGWWFSRSGIFNVRMRGLWLVIGLPFALLAVRVLHDRMEMWEDIKPALKDQPGIERRFHQIKQLKSGGQSVRHMA